RDRVSWLQQVVLNTFTVSFAMEKDAMDEMMEAPAPSVTVGGSGKIGIRNVDDSSKPDAEQFKLVRAYKVTFDSTGTTDGGLMFGAGMSIRDDTTETKDGGPVVRGSYVFVGGGDGSWKLQFGGNDPGIDLAGGFGVADDHFGGGNDATMALSGAFGDTSFRLTAADPEATGDSDNDWSVGVSHSINTISVGVGMDSEDGLAIGVGTDLSGVSTFLYWSKSELTGVEVDPFPDIDGSSEYNVSQENTGLGVKASMSAGEGTTFSVGYSTHKLEQKTIDNPDPGTGGDGTAKAKKIEVDFTYDLGGGATLSAGIDKEDAEKINVDAFAGNAQIEASDTTTLEAAIAFSF
ncbi:MAG: hypothetical protein OXH65_08355, partial [Paracoccaceae bacterium]|nr:hypothetical protein [Paracoccaceae bacterium]